MAVNESHYYYAVGRRKEAVATARLFSVEGEVTINNHPIEQYFGNGTFVNVVRQPLVLAGKDKLKITLWTKGGGKHGQAEAARLAIARALIEMAEDLRPTLKKAGYLTRDPREKERKKYGLKRARKAPQFSKR